ncbi:hypothetical protein GGS23DRAFT_495332 [Durotheca rogersii]|uniref:uncharacterized protein n=1 Tax=Durotheca rogersii TaxID=419775 RepID=UPI002220E7C4|nr:uncharacterized protein GGS23DRAFT_495332 [Durotheca rogersii]KAI5864351.1 hypothetical protein GGS23DRAFT_495332 [Durotheca rogersii]
MTAAVMRGGGAWRELDGTGRMRRSLCVSPAAPGLEFAHQPVRSLELGHASWCVACSGGAHGRASERERETEREERVRLLNQHRDLHRGDLVIVSLRRPCKTSPRRCYAIQGGSIDWSVRARTGGGSTSVSDGSGWGGGEVREYSRQVLRRRGQTNEWRGHRTRTLMGGPDTGRERGGLARTEAGGRRISIVNAVMLSRPTSAGNLPQRGGRRVLFKPTCPTCRYVCTTLTYRYLACSAEACTVRTSST